LSIISPRLKMPLTTRLEPSHPEFAARYRRLDKAIENVASAMPPLSYREDDPSTYPPLSQLDSTLPIERRMIWPHLLVLSARITLYGTLAHRDEGLYEGRLAAARDAVAILRQIQHDDANYHEVAMAVSTPILDWSAVIFTQQHWC
jgi:hypothetical protein